MNKLPTIEQMPAVPEGAVFSLAKIESVTLPHPYCITPKHIAWASDHCNGIINEAAIIDAEKHGAVCSTCRQSGRTPLPYSEHETMLTLFIKVPQNNDLNSIHKLHTYLKENKAILEKYGIQGFAFPTK